MKVQIDSDEWYPVYTIYEGEDTTEEYMTEVPDDLVERAKKVTAAFNALQEELAKYAHDW